MSPRTLALAAAAIAVLASAALTGCGGSAAPSPPPSSRLESRPGHPAGQIVLSALGAQRIGVKTAPARAIPAPGPPTGGAGASWVLVPYEAIVYDPSGRTYAFVNRAPLTYVEVPVTIDHIAGGSAFLSRGPRAGARVVSVGAEELYGVQSGVLAQT